MARVGTLLDDYGRPADRVQIIRRGKNNTRIKRSTNYGRSWAVEDELVPTGLILDDGGLRFEQHSNNPTHATYRANGIPKARLRVQRVYSTITKAQVYLGDTTWSEVEDFSTKDIVFDGGAGHGWNIPTWHEPIDTDTSLAVGELPREQGREVGERRQESTPVPVPATQVAVAPPAPAALILEASKVQRFSYLRVSSADQNLARQRAMIGDVNKEFIDEVSARSRADRPGLERCIDYLRDHDELHVASIDRLARSLVDLRFIIDAITAKGASVHFIKENLTFSEDSTDPRATLMLGILGSFAEFERTIIRERQAEGIALAKKAGKYKGRKRALSPKKVQEARRRAVAGESKVVIAKDLNVSRATLYRALKSD
ncbi:recombinase family protein [Corynebacterium marinum]|uniref:Putative resolvase n=1 Tax=Corynebacterium marinum DSM 44953 TaxID=1224162 RepID=A0A0B6TWZ9_9CORY|nr:recombinase family protein [Corynebacterium marinum]AJK70110.1 putative resolvase [Corynebacterium marinum DSM 44953]GGO22093.1 hypothetical protein GCM10010980_23790 [Corynebacterium marinum]